MSAYRDRVNARPDADAVHAAVLVAAEASERVRATHTALQAASDARTDALGVLFALGLSRREVAAMTGESVTVVQRAASELERRRAESFGPQAAVSHEPARSVRATMLEEYRVARAAQESRALDYGMGYAEETAAFFGRGGNADRVEQPLTWKMWLQHAAQERELA